MVMDKLLRLRKTLVYLKNNRTLYGDGQVIET